MSLTLSTVPLSILALYLAYRAKWRLLPVAMFMSVFQAASVLNIGSSIGVGISYLLLLGGLAKVYLKPRSPAASRSRGAKAAQLLLISFIAYAAASAFFCPFIFEGTPYTNPKMGFLVPLKWETGHLNQLFYLALCGILFFAASTRISPAEVSKCLDWYIAGNCLASVIALYQFVCLRTGLPFPADFLHSNPTYGTFEAYDIGGFARINSTFVEASAAASVLTPALAILFWRLLDRPNWKDARAALLIFTGLFLTISTTGYLCFGFLLAISAVIFAFKWRPRAEARAAKLIFAAIILCLTVGASAVPSVRTSIADLLDIVIFSKTKTFSYEQRTEMNNDAWNTAADTKWMGAGFGVCRASSLVPTLFGNVGIPGMLLFTGFLAAVFQPAWRARRSRMNFVGQPIFASAVALCALVIAGPEITNPAMWLFFAGSTAALPRQYVRQWALSDLGSQNTPSAAARL